MSERHRCALPALLLVAAFTAGCGDGRARSGEWQTLSTQRQVAGEQNLVVDVEYAAGRFSVAPTDVQTLYAVDMRYDANVYRPATVYEAGRLRLGLEGGGSVRGRNIGDGFLRLGVNPAVATALDLRFGAVVAEIELGGLSLQRVSVQTGASETRITVAEPNRLEAERVRIEAGAARLQARQLGNLNAAALSVSGGVGDILLDFSGAWQRDMTATIDVGLGALTLQFPRGLGVRISRSGALSGFDGQELVRRGNVYYTEGFDAAERKLEITLNAAVGRVRVVWTDDALTG
jgi:hypothetical protein